MSRRDFKAARQLFDLGKPADAERIYQRILAATPTDALALHNLGVAQFRQGRVAEAIQSVRHALARDLDRRDHFVTMAALLADPDHSHRLEPEAVPDDARALCDLGLSQYRAGDVHEAILTLRQAITRDLNTPALFAEMAEMLDHPDYRAHLDAPLQGGAFNGQALRQAMFRELVGALQPATIFETGSFHGTTTDFMARETTAHVFTCELDPNFHWFCAQRFAAAPNITLVNLDSRQFLARYVPRFAGDAPCLFYLDAHWDATDLPLLEELRIVLAQAPHSIVLIDDFEVWDDPGYSYDDYGPTRRLTLDYLAPLDALGPRYFFPLGSDDETGAKRGSVVLTIDPEFTALLAGLSKLRPARARRWASPLPR